MKKPLTFDSSRRYIEATRGIIGIDDDGNVFEGADGDLDTPRSTRTNLSEPASFTDAERKELADFMIDRWRVYGRAAAAGGMKDVGLVADDKLSPAERAVDYIARRIQHDPDLAYHLSWGTGAWDELFKALKAMHPDWTDAEVKNEITCHVKDSR